MLKSVTTVFWGHDCKLPPPARTTPVTIHSRDFVSQTIFLLNDSNTKAAVTNSANADILLSMQPQSREYAESREYRYGHLASLFMSLRALPPQDVY
jgi:hypothetical protein